ncbi:MAG: site-specific integrase [Gammaproteobacteria bacterium]|nr:site-specific integrase [Gammaproteobacteria bacterium]
MPSPRFLILTAARSGEARGARWVDMDFDTNLWTIPGERMKAGRTHRVPLSAAALAVLDQARALSDGEGLVFPGRNPGKPLSDMALTMVLRRAGLAERTTVHGFRSAFRGWCAESGVAWEVAEAALAHVVGNATEQAYYRTDLLEARKPIMERWAALALRRAAKVAVLR